MFKIKYKIKSKKYDEYIGYKFDAGFTDLKVVSFDFQKNMVHYVHLHDQDKKECDYIPAFLENVRNGRYKPI